MAKYILQNDVVVPTPQGLIAFRTGTTLDESILAVPIATFVAAGARLAPLSDVDANNVASLIARQRLRGADPAKDPGASPFAIDTAFRVVATLAERDAISSRARQLGMHVYVVETSLTYLLTGALSNADWVVASAEIARTVSAGDVGLATLSAAIATIGSAVTVLVIKADFPAGGSCTVPSTLTLQFAGGRITGSSGQTINVNGPVRAGTTQIFALTGTAAVVFGADFDLHPTPQWFGALATASDDDALQRWYDSLVNGVQGRIPAGIYKLTFPTGVGLQFDKTFIRMIGDGSSKTTIRADAPCAEGMIRWCGVRQYLSGVTLEGNRNASEGILFLKGIECLLEDVEIRMHLHDGMYLAGANRYPSLGASSGTYNGVAWGWTARELASNPSKTVNNSVMRFAEVSSTFNGSTYKSSAGMQSRSGQNEFIRGGSIRYDTATSSLIATAPASFTLSPSSIREWDMVRVRATIDSRGGAGLVDVNGTATLVAGETKARIVGGNLLSRKIRAGDRITFITGAGNFVVPIRRILSDEYILFDSPVPAPNAGSGFEFVIDVEYIFAVQFPSSGTTCQVMSQFTLPFDVPTNEYAIMVGDGYREEFFGDNNENVQEGGFWRCNAGAGRWIQGLYATRIRGGITDFNNGFALIIGSLVSGQGHINANVSKLYTESNTCGNILIASAQGVWIERGVNGNNAMSPSSGQRDDVEFMNKALASAEVTTNFGENRGLWITNTAGITFDKYTLSVNSAGMPIVSDHGAYTRRLLEDRPFTLTTSDTFSINAGATLVRSCTVLFPISSLTAEQLALIRPRVDHVASLGPIRWTVIGFAYNYTQQQFEFTVSVTNDHIATQSVTLWPAVL